MRILVVDDRGGTLAIVATVLRAFGFREVHRVTSGDDGIAHLKANRVDLVIVDLSYGTAKHLELARFLSESKDPALQQVPIIMLTRPTKGRQGEEADTVSIGGFTGTTYTPDALLNHGGDAVGLPVRNRKKKRILH